MKKLISALCLCLLAVPAFAAETGYYLGGNAGVMIPQDSTVESHSLYDTDASYHTGFTLSAVGGYKFANNLRIEGELTGKSATLDKVGLGKSSGASYVSNVGMLANVFYDIKTSTPLSPYFGGGIGVAYMFIDDSTIMPFKTYDASGSAVFAYQAGAGFTIDAIPKITLDFGYRYYGTTEAEFDVRYNGTDKMSFNSHNLTVGARYNF